MRSVGQWLRERQGTFAAFLLCIVLFLVGALHTSGFANLSNIQQMLVFASFIGFAALGQTFVILAGGLDLSVPWVIAFGGIVLSRLSASGVAAPLAIVIVVAAGVLIGLLNGVGVTVLRIPPIVMTLGAGGLVEAYLMAVGQLQSTGDQVPRLAVELAANKAGPVPVVTIAWLALAVVASVVLSRTAYGRYVHAVGASDTVARLSGIRVGRVRLLTYAVSGATSAFAGVVLAGYVGTTYLDIGAPYLFTSIAAVVVGGASILGGRGTYWGTVAGSMTLTLLSTILPLFNLSSADLDIVYGAVILVGVWLATNGTVLSNAFRRAIPGIGGQTK